MMVIKWVKYHQTIHKNLNIFYIVNSNIKQIIKFINILHGHPNKKLFNFGQEILWIKTTNKNV